MKKRDVILFAGIIVFSICLLGGIYLNALNHRYSVIIPQSFIIMDNWTKKIYVLPNPRELKWSHYGKGAKILE